MKDTLDMMAIEEVRKDYENFRVHNMGAVTRLLPLLNGDEDRAWELVFSWASEDANT